MVCCSLLYISSTQHLTCSPFRDDEVRFQIPEGTSSTSLKISVLDDADSRPELVGDATIPLAEAYDSPPTQGYDKWHELSYKGKYAGEVYLEMTFYPSQPRKYKKSASRLSSSCTSKTLNSSLSVSTSQFGLSVSSRPLPTSPIKHIDGGIAGLRDSLANLRVSQQKLAHNHVFAASVSCAKPPQMGRASLPTSLSVPAISNLASSIAPKAPPHRSSVYNPPRASNSLLMSLATTDAAIAQEIDLPAIPPEPPQHLSDSTASKTTVSESSTNILPNQKTDADFEDFFNTPIDSMPPEKPTTLAATIYSSIANLLPGAAPKQNTLSQSTNSNQSIETIKADSLPPLTQELDEKQYSQVKRKPVESRTNNGSSAAPVLPYPGAAYTTDPKDPNIDDDDDLDYRNAPFSADSYVSSKPQPVSLSKMPPSPPKETFGYDYQDQDGMDSNPALSKIPSLSVPKSRRQPLPSLPDPPQTISNQYQMGNGNRTRSGLRQQAPYLSSIGRTSSIAPSPTPPAHTDPLSISVSSTGTVHHHQNLSKSVSILGGPRKPTFYSNITNTAAANSVASPKSRQPSKGFQENNAYFDENYDFYGNDYQDDYCDDGYSYCPTPASAMNRSRAWN